MSADQVGDTYYTCHNCLLEYNIAYYSKCPHCGFPRTVIPNQDPDNFDEVEEKNVETGVNPKDLIGVSKIPLSIVPWSAVGGMCLALLDGASKYGPFNWRDIPVQSHIYIEAGLGHLMSYADGEDNAQDSGLFHLYHAMACCAIIIDAIQSGRLKDTRYTLGRPGTGTFSRDPLKYLGDQEKIKELLKRPWRTTSMGSKETDDDKREDPKG